MLRSLRQDVPLNHGVRPLSDLYEVGSGALLRRVRVPLGAGALSASGPYAVFRVGRDVYVTELRTGGARKLLRAASVPIGLSIEGRRVAWGENVGSGGRVRAVTLPR